MEVELWKSLEEFKDVEVSSLGRVRKINRFGKEVVLSEFPKDRDGYCRCSVRKRSDNKYTSHPVYRLVAKAFLPNPLNKPAVNHIDGNRENNRVDNLEWVTARENVLHSYRYGARKICKEVPRNTLLTDYQISQIDRLRELYSVNQLSKLFNIGYTSLKNIIHKKKQCGRLDNQQPSIYDSIYEGSTTIPDGSK